MSILALSLCEDFGINEAIPCLCDANEGHIL